MDFKGQVSDADFQRLMDFPYIDSKEELELFTIFIRALEIKKIKGIIQVAQPPIFQLNDSFRLVEPQNKKQMDYPVHPQISVEDSLGTLAVNP